MNKTLEDWKQKFEHWLIHNLQFTSKSNVQLIIDHVERYIVPAGYAAAPQKGMRWVKASERLPEKEGLVHYHIENGLHDICFYHKQRGFYKPKMVNPTSERMKLDRDLELIPLPYSLDKIYYLDESPSPSEAGDEIEIIDGYTQLAIDRRSLPKDGQHVKFMTENEEFHEGYFVGGDDIFHVTDSKFFFKWHVQQWKGI